MAGEWISIEHDTPDKPEVIHIADKLGIDQDAVVGKLIRVWVWVDQQTLDGIGNDQRYSQRDASVTISVTRAFIDRRTCAAGFADAMISVGWLADDGSGKLTFPSLDKHLTQTAKQRSLGAKRAARHRIKSNAKRYSQRDASVTISVTPSVTGALPTERTENNSTVSVQREICFSVSDIEPIARLLFAKASYLGDDGGFLWKLAALQYGGRLSQAAVIESISGPNFSGAKNPIAYARGVLRKTVPDFDAMLKAVRVKPKLPKSAPSIAAAVQRPNLSPEKPHDRR